jgi:hypothetical protein
MICWAREDPKRNAGNMYAIACMRYFCASSLHKARLPEHRFLMVEERPVTILWGSLQAHKKMEELTKKQFLVHPLLSHVLNLHLRQQSVCKVDHLTLLNQLTGCLFLT